MEYDTESITNAAIKRITREVGIQRISYNVGDFIRYFMVDFIYEILNKAIIFASHGKRKTLNKIDIIAALEVMNYGYAIGETFVQNKHLNKTKTKSGKKTHKSRIKFFIPLLPFDKLVRSIGNSIDGDRHYSEDFFMVLQTITIAHTLRMLENAKKISQGRPTLLLKDLQLLQELDV